MLTASSLISRYPIINGFPEDVIDQVLAKSELKFDPLLWKNEIIRDQAIGLLVVHTLVMELQQTLNLVQQDVLMREGEDYKSNKYTNNYSATLYGLQLLELLNNSNLGIL